VSISGEENLAYYTMGFKSGRKAFCKECGVFVIHDVNPLSPEEIAALPEGARHWRKAQGDDWAAVSVRFLDGVDVTEVEKRAKSIDMTSLGKPYVNP
jgi:hypothetical protein